MFISFQSSAQKNHLFLNNVQRANSKSGEGEGSVEIFLLGSKGKGGLSELGTEAPTKSDAKLLKHSAASMVSAYVALGSCYQASKQTNIKAISIYQSLFSLPLFSQFHIQLGNSVQDERKTQFGRQTLCNSVASCSLVRDGFAAKGVG